MVNDLRSRRITLVWLGTGAILLLALALLGLVMRVAQAVPGLISARVFYAMLTLHGSGMAGISLTIIAALFWYLMRRTLPLSPAVMQAAYGLTMTGALLLVLAAARGFGAGWTMLYPLPAMPGPVPAWDRWAAGLFIAGFALIIGAFALWSFDFLRAGVARYGSLGRMLGLDVLAGTTAPGAEPASPSVIAGAVVAVDGIATLLPGTVLATLMLANLVAPSFVVNPLLAKNLDFFAGHVLANVQIYIGAGVAYALLPLYTHRPWKTGKVLVAGWLVTLILVMLSAFHHLYQDFAEPVVVQIIGNIASYASAFPPIVVTIFAGVMLVHRSGMRWKVAPLFLYAGFAGWAIGGYAAIIDSSPALNQYLHNTLWVPAYFHTFMALSVVFFMLGGVYHVMPELTGRSLAEQLGKKAAALLLIGGWGLVGTWFLAGALGQPRRYTFYLAHVARLGWLGAGCVLIATLGMALIFGDVVRVVVSYVRTNDSPS